MTDNERREILCRLGHVSAGWVVAATGLAWFAGYTKQAEAAVPALDMSKCIICGRCAAVCAKAPIPAIQAVNAQSACRHCGQCYSYTRQDNGTRSVQLVCPYDAVRRKKNDDGEYVYTVDQTRCRGCGACVRECMKHGTGSMRLQVIASLCKQCAECPAIRACPRTALTRNAT